MEETKYEMVNHPSHYNNYDIEVIEMMRRIWGNRNVALWSMMTAFKYRQRLGLKPDNPIEQDLDKERFYLDRYKEYTENWKKDSDIWSSLTENDKEYITFVYEQHKKNEDLVKSATNGIGTKELLTD